MKRFELSPGTEVIKSLVGNYKSGNLTTIYGNAASGKTTTAMLASISAVRQGGKVIFIDTEKGFSSERLNQLAKNNEKVLENIFLLQPKNFQEQHDIILRVKKLAENEKIKLVIVDTIGKYYRVVLKKNPKQTNKKMVTQLRNLVRIARDLNKVVLLTNQVYANLEKEEGVKMVGGTMMENISKILIELYKSDSEPSERYAKLVKHKTEKENTTHYNLNKRIKFEIMEKGLFNLQ